jgi:hypothetical protein
VLDRTTADVAAVAVAFAAGAAEIAVALSKVATRAVGRGA